MSQENSSRTSYPTWGLLLALTVLAALLVVNIPQLSQATRANLAAVMLLKEWSRESKDLSQILCDNSGEPALPVTESSQIAPVNAARRAYYAGDCASALAYWTLAAQNDPRNESAAIMRFLSAGQAADMLPEGLAPGKAAEFLEGLGMASEENQRTDDAVYWYANSFELAPSRSVADSLARLQEDDGNEPAVWQALGAALPEDDPNHWWALGKEAELAQQWEEAAGYYNTGAQIAADPFEFLMAEGELLLRLDRLEEAEPLFRQSLTLRPHNSRPYIQLGHLYGKRSDHAAAKEWYEKAVQIAPDMFTQNYHLGREYLVLDEFESAERYLARAVEINPQISAAHYLLAHSIYQNGRQSEALVVLEEAVRRDKDGQWSWLVELGDWRAAAGDPEGALTAYYQALRLQPNHPKITAKIQEIENG